GYVGISWIVRAGHRSSLLGQPGKSAHMEMACADTRLFDHSIRSLYSITLFDHSSRGAVATQARTMSTAALPSRLRYWSLQTDFRANYLAAARYTLHLGPSCTAGDAHRRNVRCPGRCARSHPTNCLRLFAWMARRIAHRRPMRRSRPYVA